MTATLSMVPVAQIRPSKGFNPRAEFDDDAHGRAHRVSEASRDHHTADPLPATATAATRSSPGERRYRAASKAAKLRRRCLAQVREVEGEALTLAVAENVIRADLSPLEEARAYRRLVDGHGDAAKVAKLVGKSERLVSDRLELLRLPGADARRPPRRPSCVPLACAPAPRARRSRSASRSSPGPSRPRWLVGAPARRGGLPSPPPARS